MKVYHGIEAFKKLSMAVVTSGTFDGVHLGHKKILDRLKEISRHCNGETVVITFWPHPRVVLHPENHEVKILSTIEEKTALLSAFGIDHLIVIPFTKEFSQLSSEEFIQNILINTIGTKKLVIGYDHRFGKNREGSFENLRKDAPIYGFEVEEIPRQDIDHEIISSTNIRKALVEGDVSTAIQFLGYPYRIRGKVVQGKQLGRSIGYPTANIKVTEKLKLIPADGIYAVEVTIEGNNYKGMMSIGFNPTVNGKERTIEVNIFDFNNDIYHKDIEIGFIKFLRKEEKFSDLEALIKQLAQDERMSRAIFDLS